jgi:hypothetical protein
MGGSIYNTEIGCKSYIKEKNSRMKIGTISPEQT